MKAQKRSMTPTNPSQSESWQVRMGFIIHCSVFILCIVQPGRGGGQGQVSDLSGSLQTRETPQDTIPAIFSGACLLCHCARSSGPLCFIYNNISHVLHYPDPPRAGPAFIGLPPLSLSAAAARGGQGGSAHKGRAANHRRPFVNLSQWEAACYLHRDESDQWGVSTGEDSHPSAQWLREG